MCFMDWALMLEFVKAIFSWPPIVLVIVIFLAQKFAHQWGKMIDRLRDVKFPGGGASLDPEQQQLEPAVGKVDLPGPDQPQAQPVVQGQVNFAIPQEAIELAGSTVDEARGAAVWIHNNPGETLNTFIETAFKVSAERTFNLIFGTQVLLLQHLQMVNRPTPVSELMPFFNRHVELGGRADALRPYLQFLEGGGFMINRADVEGPLYELTMRGRRFLDYIKQYYPTRWNTQPR